MKKIHWLIVRSFIGPFLVVFFIAMFVLLMQFMWRYIDEFVGKGLEFKVIAEFLLYTSATLVPSALPLAILMSSLMTFGNLGERYELTAMKASGISLQRIMAPMIILVVFVSFAEFFFVNEVMPYSNLKLFTLLHDIRDKRPAVHIQEGEFYGGIDNYSIRVNRKDPETNKLYDIIIYDHSNGQNVDVTIADSGKMEVTADDANMVFTLWNGHKYLESQDFRQPLSKRNYPHQYVEFEEQKFVIKLIGYDLERSEGGLFKNHHAMLDIAHLGMEIDSVNKEIQAGKDNLYDEIYYKRLIYLASKDLEQKAKNRNIKNIPEEHEIMQKTRRKNLPEKKAKELADKIEAQSENAGDLTDSIDAQEELAEKPDIDLEEEDNPPSENIRKTFDQAAYISPDSLLQILDPAIITDIYSDALSFAKKTKSRNFSTVPSLDFKTEKLRRFEIEWHRKFVLSFACMIFLLLGAPLGAIIRKGGLGLPLVISTLFFIFWYIINLTTEKMVRVSQLDSVVGMWMPSTIFFIVGLFLTYKATTDAQMMNMDTYSNFFKKIFGQRYRLIDILKKDINENEPKKELQREKLLQSLKGFLDDTDSEIETVRNNLKPIGFIVSLFGVPENSQLVMLDRLYKNIMRLILKSTYIHNRPIRSKIEEFPNLSASYFIDERYKLIIKIGLLFIPIIALFILPQQKFLAILAPGIAVLILLRHYILLVTLRTRLLNIQQYTRDLFKLINQAE